MLRLPILVAGLVLATPSFAEPPTPEQIEAKRARAIEYYQNKGEDFSFDDPEFHAVLDAQLEGIDPAECDFQQVMSMQMLWAYSPSAKPVWMERLRALGDTESWLDVALVLAREGELDEAIAIGSARGGFAAVPDQRLGEVMSVMSNVDAEMLAPMRDELVLLADRLPADGGSLLGWVDYPSMLGMAGVDAETRMAIHARLVEAIKASMATVNEPRSRAMLDNAVDYLSTVPGRGELLGAPAPAIQFTWNSDGEDWNCFRCLAGKVIVVDFWATWCGPCVGSFPDVKELVDYYDGYDVVFLGVTSPQGNVVFRDERGRVNTPEFEDECRELLDYKNTMEMTWPIVMTKQEVFNPDFGVRGIPHVAIISPDGKVAHNGLHPGGDKAGKIDKINRLLAKANLKHPPSLADSKANDEG